MSNNAEHPPNNGAVLNIAQIIKAVMSSAAESELGALYINAKEAVYIQQILKAMGHQQQRHQQCHFIPVLTIPHRPWRCLICWYHNKEYLKEKAARKS